MDELMEMLTDFVTLGDQVTRGATLSPDEHARWLALTRLIPGTGAPPGPNQEDSAEDGAPVQAAGAGGFESAMLMAVSRDGMRLRLDHPMAEGVPMLVRVVTPRSGFEYTFPCRVVWRDQVTMGLAFDGVPARSPLAFATRTGWQRPLDLRTGWGARAAPSLA